LIDRGLLETRKLGTARRVLEESLNNLLEKGYDNDESELGN